MDYSGSPIAARLSLNPVTVLLIVAIVAVIIAIFFVFNKLLNAYRESTDYAIKNQDRPTTRKDISKISKKLELNDTEHQILSSIFKANPVPNIIFAVKDTDIVEYYLKEAWTKLDEAKDEEAKPSIFTLRHKLIDLIDSRTIMKNTRVLPIQTILKYTPSQGIHLAFIVVDSNQEELWMEMPETMKEEEKPAILSKIKFKYDDPSSNPYEIEARVIRYQKNKNDKELLVCAHSDKVFPLQKRIFQRLDLNIACAFSSVKAETVTEGKTSHTSYTASEKIHEGVLADISSGGCRIFTSLPIKAEQYLQIKGKLDGQNENSAIGKILRTTKNRNDEYILHIKFVKIDLSISNSINAAACGYSG